MKRLMIPFLTILLNLGMAQQEKTFYQIAVYDSSVPTVQQVFGFGIGDKPLRHHQVRVYFDRLAESSSNFKVYSEGQTHEARDLFYAVITSEENFDSIKNIRENLKKLSDPRISDNGSGIESIIKESPAVAVMMYSIHGDELSGTDAGVYLAYHLLADRTEETKALLENLIIIIYPMENPDGRERFLSQVEVWEGQIPNSDIQSLPHSGVWPNGRTNHYYFDLNRDWFINSQPETHARIKLVKEWMPQLVVDAHEMGSFSTYLFNPPREPINPNMHKRIIEWWEVFAGDQAASFDRYGWSYYTREWLEEWYPGYGSSYPSYRGAVSILYEQASTDGSLVKKPDGTELTFGESVHHQFISSMANLLTLMNNREKLLSDYFEVKKDAVNNSNSEGIKAFVLDPSGNEELTNKLADNLIFQGIEIYRTGNNIELSGVIDFYDREKNSAKVPKGSFVIPMAQPLQPLIKAVMEFETRLDNKYLKWERESLLKGEGTKLYEVSAWSLPVAYGLKAYASYSDVEHEETPLRSIANSPGIVDNRDPDYGYIIDYNPGSAQGIINLLEHGYKLRAARKNFRVDGKEYDKGSILIRLNENPTSVSQHLIEIADNYGLQVHGIGTALSQSGPDLGGGEFDLIYPPKIAMLTGPGISMNNFGELWYLLDFELRLRITKLHINYLSRADLNKYNIIILPSGYSSFLKEQFDKNTLNKLKDWITGGGTLIAIGNSSVFVADSSTGLSKVKLRRQSLSSLNEFAAELNYEKSIYEVEIDSLYIWENKIPEKKVTPPGSGKEDIKALEVKDKEALKFMPDGVILRVDLNSNHWLTYGLEDKIPVFYSSSYAFLSKRPVETAARMASKDKIRLSGLLWPEAADRLENSAYSTRESLGRGQIILFADSPNFRSYFYASAGLFINAVILGPGFGTSQTVEW